MRWLWLVVGWVQVMAGFLVEYAGWRARYRHADFGPGAQPGATGSVVLASDWLAFLFGSPLGWLALWLIGEGVLRVLAAGMNVPFGTLPVAALRFVARHARATPPPPPDHVEHEGDDLIVKSAIDYRWDALSTVDVDGALYAVRGEHSASATHPHRWRLVPVPKDHTVRQVSRYDRRAAMAADQRPRRSLAKRP